jgi:nucleotide-binding universal stress UspA family protein
MKMTNVLVPVDFSDASRKAVRYGAVLALKSGARLTVAHIVPSFAAFNYAFPGDTYEFEKKAYAEAREQLPREIPAEFGAKLDTQSIVKGGDVRDELLAIVKEEHVDMVVMGTHGRRHIERFFLGSTTESMLRRLPVPVLTVSYQASADRPSSPFEVPFRRILYATDFSGPSKDGLHYCADLARAFGAELHLLHVMDLRDASAFDDEAEIRRNLNERLKQEASGVRLQAATEVVRGTPHHEILKYGERVKADLLVINLQSKSLLDRAILGATAERVIRCSPIPVLSIPVGAADRNGKTSEQTAGGVSV